MKRIGMPSVLLWTAMITVGCDSAAPDVNPAPRADAGTQKEASVDTGLDVVEAQAPDVEQDVVDDGGCGVSSFPQASMWLGCSYGRRQRRWRYHFTASSGLRKIVRKRRWALS